MKRVVSVAFIEKTNQEINFDKSFGTQCDWNNRERKHSDNKQKPEASQGEKGKLKEVELYAHLNEEVKEEVEDSEQNVQTILSPPPHHQLEPATSVRAESILVHPSERPLQSEEESSNVQPTITTTIDGSGFPVTDLPFPKFQHNSFIIVISPGVPTAISALPKLTVFPPGSRLYLSDPKDC
nr:hypothetical transcript [Hymenolepis microstoma]